MTKKTINASMEIQSEDPETYNTLLNLQKTAHNYYIKYSSDMKSLCALWAGLNITLFLSPNATYLSGNDIIFFINQNWIGKSKLTDAGSKLGNLTI